MKYEEIKEGMRVIKARSYNAQKYCAYGGDPEQVPIGTEGEVIHAEQPKLVRVQFKGLEPYTWSVHPKEIEPAKPGKLSKLKIQLKVKKIWN